jgi:hypothetical protein
MVTDELVAVFDADGQVTGAAPRSCVYAEGLWHASAGVLVRSTDGSRIYVHRRTTTKAVFAGMHDCLARSVISPRRSPTVGGGPMPNSSRTSRIKTGHSCRTPECCFRH